MGLLRWLRNRDVRKLPSSAELDRRVQDARRLSAEGDRHVRAAQELRRQNRMAAIIEKSLGLNGGGK